jgi:glycosyltransferase involved in cell wall biosynthesis
MRVLVWSDLFWPYIGGPELLVARLMLELRERGHEFLVVTSHDYLELPDEATYEGIPVHRLPFRAAIAGRDLDQLQGARRRVAEVKREYAPDLVHATVVGPSLFFHLRTADVHPAPWLAGLQTEVLGGQWDGEGTLLYQAMLSATWVAACSQTVLAQARRLAPEITARSSVIRNGVDVAAAPGEPPRAPRLLCLGRLLPAKGFDLALTALATLLGRFPALRLTIAGDGTARRELEQQAAALGVEGAVDFLGWVDPDRVPQLIGASSIVLMPSRREGLGLAAVQAASMARPIVATRVGGLPEVVVHDQSGMLVDADDARGLAEAIAFLLEHPDEAARMGRRARRRVRETFRFDRYADAYDALYRTVTRR